MRFSLAIVALATVVAAKPRSCKYSDIADEQVELEGLYQSLDEVKSPWEKFWINREIKELKAELKKCGVTVDSDQPEGTTSTIGIADKRDLSARARTYSCKYSDIADEQVELEGLYQDLEDAQKPWEKFWLSLQIKELKAELKKCGVTVDPNQPEGTTSTIGIADKRDLSSPRVARRAARRAKRSCKYSDIADEQVELEGLYADLEEADKPWEKFWIKWQIKELKAELKKCGITVDDDQPEGTTTTIGIADKRDLKPLPKWLTDKYAECVARPHSNPMSAIWLAQAAEISPSLLGGASVELKIASRQSIGCGSVDALEDYLFYLFAVYGSKPSPYQLALMQKAFEIVYTCGRDVSRWTTVVPALTIPGASTTITPSTGSSGSSTTITPSTGSSGSSTTITPSTGSSGSGTSITPSTGSSGSGSGTSITPSTGSSGSGTTITGSGGNSGQSGSSITPSGSSTGGTSISGSSGGTSSGGNIVQSGATSGSGVRIS